MHNMYKKPDCLISYCLSVRPSVWKNKGPHPFPRENNYKIAKMHWWNLKIFFSRTTGPIQLNFAQSCTKHPWMVGISSFLKWRATPFSKGRYMLLRNSKNTFNWWILKIFFSRNSPLISLLLGQKHPWVVLIQVCSNEGPRPFPKGDNYKIVKILWQNLDKFPSRITGPISTKLRTKHPWVKGIQVCSNKLPGKGHTFFQGEIITK